jgi:hypothetical protein
MSLIKWKDYGGRERRLSFTPILAMKKLILMSMN